MIRLGILISGSGATLENLAAAITSKELCAQIVTVIASNDTCYGIERAKRLNLPVTVISRKQAGSIEQFSQQIAQHLRDHRVELVLMAGFLSLWQIPDDFAGKVMNIHPALLPKFGGVGMHGRHVHEAVLAASETESGCTVHFADNTYDHGPIILQWRVPVLPTDTPDSLADRVLSRSALRIPKPFVYSSPENAPPYQSRHAAAATINSATITGHFLASKIKLNTLTTTATPITVRISVAEFGKIE